MTLVLILAFAAAQQDAGAEEAIAAQRAELRAAIRMNCPLGTEDDDIVVCGRSRDAERQRLPQLEPVAAGTRAADRAAGEQMAALEADSSRCSTVGRAQSCGGVDLLGAGIMLIREIVRGIERRRD